MAGEVDMGDELEDGEESRRGIAKQNLTGQRILLRFSSIRYSSARIQGIQGYRYPPLYDGCGDQYLFSRSFASLLFYSHDYGMSVTSGRLGLYLESLPVEIMRKIFFECLEINLPRASPYVVRILSGRHVYTAMKTGFPCTLLPLPSQLQQ
ncbi:hypothetical protein V8E54_009219 [Elaphomyces granulatus]